MTRYLISFDDGAMTFPEEDLPAVAKAAHAVLEEAKKHRRDGRRRPDPGENRVPRRILDHRRAVTREGAGVGCQVRRRLPLRSRGP